MVNVTYDTQLTALLVIDPYNDFISEGGKLASQPLTPENLR
jgi:ureidoacrylate peracid hydrolase